MNTRPSTRLPLLLLALLVASPLALRAQQDERAPVDGSVPSDAHRGSLVTPESAEMARGGRNEGNTLSQPRRPGDPQALRVAPVPDPPRYDYVRYLRPDIWTTRNAFPIGDTLDLYFRVDEDAFVYIFNTDTRGRVTQIFPNYFDTRNRVRANRTYRIPDRGYQLEVQGPPGVETIHILAVSERYSPLRIYEYFSKSNPFPSNITGPLDMLRELDAEARRSAPYGNDSYAIQGRPGGNTGRIAPVPDPPRPPSYVYGCAALSFRTYERRPHQPNYDYYYNEPGPPVPDYDVEATLRVNTSPTRARVYLDGDFQGLSPLTIHARPGEYELLVQKMGYQTEVRTIRLGPREEERISLRLEKTPRMWFFPR